MTKRLVVISTLLCISLLSGCATDGGRPFAIKNLAKSDTDMVADAHIEAVHKLLRQLTIKLYKRNPRELSKAPPGTTIETRLNQIFGQQAFTRYPELYNQYGTHAIPLAFDPSYKGDRVFALMAGVYGMIYASYSFHTELYILDDLNQQSLYNSARNLEAISWRMNNKYDPNGDLFILSNGTTEQGIRNLSYARIFGKLIAYQDMMARIVADKNNRTINNVFVGVTSTVLLPI